MTLAMELKRMFAEGERTGEQKKETMMILEMLREGISKESVAECARISGEHVVELGKRIICCNLSKAAAAGRRKNSGLLFLYQQRRVVVCCHTKGVRTFLAVTFALSQNG